MKSPSQPSFSDWFAVCILVLLATFLFFLRLGDSPLWNNDETYYASIAQDMVRTGRWIGPHFNGAAQFDKPPLVLWLVALGFHAFGVSEFAARAWSALFGVGGVLATYVLGRDLYGKEIGLWAGVVVATSLQYVVQAHLLTMDMVLTFFLTVTLIFLHRGLHRQRPEYITAAAVTAGLATLTKGIIGVALPGVIAVVYLIFDRQVLKLVRLRLGRAALAYVAVAAPWYVIETVWHRAEFVREFFFLRHFVRYLSPLEGQGGNWYYYLPVVFLGFFPWICLLPWALRWRAAPAAGTGESPPHSSLFLAIWTVVILVFFSLAQTKLPNYILPLYPALAVMAASFWDTARRHTGSLLRGPALPFGLILGFSVLFMVAVHIILSAEYAQQYQQYQGVIIPVSAIVAAGAGLAFVLHLWRRQVVPCLLVLVATLTVFTVLLVTVAVPAIDALRPTRDLARQIRTALQPGDVVALYRDENPGLVFYTAHRVILLADAEQLVELFRGEKRVFCMMTKERYRSLLPKLGTISYHVWGAQANLVVLSNQGQAAAASLPETSPGAAGSPGARP